MSLSRLEVIPFFFFKDGLLSNWPRNIWVHLVLIMISGNPQLIYYADFMLRGIEKLKLHLSKLHLQYLHCIHNSCVSLHIPQALSKSKYKLEPQRKNIILNSLSYMSLLQVWFQQSSTFWFTWPLRTDPETLVQCQKSMPLYCCMTKQFAKGDCNYTVVFFFSWLPARELLVIIHVMQCHSVSDSWVKPQHCGLVVWM